MEQRRTLAGQQPTGGGAWRAATDANMGAEV